LHLGVLYRAGFDLTYPGSLLSECQQSFVGLEPQAGKMTGALFFACLEKGEFDTLNCVIHAEILSVIETTLNQILVGKGVARVVLTGDMVLLDGAIPIDSLDLAQIVLELQSVTGRDPFEGGFIEFRTVGELASLFSL
jgi:hypothetical protein